MQLGFICLGTPIKEFQDAIFEKHPESTYSVLRIA